MRDEALKALTRILAREENPNEVRYRLDRLEHFIGRWRNFDRDYEVGMVLRECKPAVADAVVSKWLTHHDPLYRRFAVEVLGILRLQRSTKHLRDRLLDDNEKPCVRRGAALALGNLLAEEAYMVIFHAARQGQSTVLGETQGQGDIRDGVLKALSRLLYFAEDQADVKSLVDKLLTSSDQEIVAYTIYSLGILDWREDVIVSKLDSDHWYERSAAALSYARIKGGPALSRLSKQERETAGHVLERLLVLCALVRAGATEKSVDLHHALCAFNRNVRDLQYPWQREILYALAQDGEQGQCRASAWADLMHVDLRQCLDELP